MAESILAQDKSNLFLGEGDMSPDRERRLRRALDDDLARHRTRCIEDDRAVAFFADVVVDRIADFLDRVLHTAHQELVALLDVLFEFARRMLDDHVREIRADALIEQDRTLVVLEERAREIADSCDRNIVFNFHDFPPYIYTISIKQRHKRHERHKSISTIL